MKRFYISYSNNLNQSTQFYAGIDSDKITFVSYGIIVTQEDGTRVHIPWHAIAQLEEKNE